MRKVLILILSISVSAIQTVDHLNFRAYLGNWYSNNRYQQRFEVASSPSVIQNVQINRFCQQSTYSQLKFGQVEVTIRQRKGSNKGEFVFMRGQASQTNVFVPGKLTVDFGYQMKAQYWIYALGPIVNGLYAWSVVSDPNQNYLWVMARDPNIYVELYEHTVRNSMVIRQLGFNSEGCDYIPRSYDGCVPYEV